MNARRTLRFTSRLTIEFACTLALFALPAGNASAQSMHRVALDDPAGQAPHLIDGERYTFSTSEIPETVLPEKDPRRTVAFGSTVRLGYSGARAGSTYTVRLTFVSELQRSISITANGAALNPSLQIPPGEVLHVEYPVAADADGEIDLQLRCIDGPNAEVSEVEVLSSDATALQPMKDPQQAAQRRMDAVIAQLPGEPAPLSPRPASVEGVKTPLMSLNGQWKFSPEAPPDLMSDTGGWKNINVPGEWVMQAFTVAKGGTADYSRSIDIPADWHGKRVKLRFDSVNSDCKVFVNGQVIGQHEGGFVPFECDITSALIDRTNRLDVQVQTETTSDILGSVSQYAAHPVGGILRKVQMFVLPRECAIPVASVVRLDDGGASATLTIKLQRTPGDAWSQYKFEPHLFAPDGIEVPVQHIDEVTPTKFDQDLILRIDHPLLWNSEHPRLYQLQLDVLRNGARLERFVSHIGFRQVEVKGNQLLVNFKPVKLLGVCRHEVSPLTGRSLSPELCRRDAELFRAANCNYIRTSHYPPSDEFLDAADELGLFVEDESALCWIQHNANAYWKTNDYRDPKYLPYMVRANLEKMAAGRDHPSVILWSLGNESYWSPLWAEVMKRVAALDPTRPITFHDQCWGGYDNGNSTAPIGVYHYPGLNGPGKCDKEPRPILFGEYSHIECYNRRELVTDPGMRDDWGRPQEKMVDLIQSHPGCLGGAIWSGIDDIFHLPDGKIVGYGSWGIIDGWRREKPEYWHVKKTYSPIRVVDRDKPIEVGVTTLKIPIENRYNFSNLSEVKIDWAIGSQKGIATADIAPRTSGVLEIKLPQATQPGQSLELNFTDPRGFICESEVLRVSAIEPAKQALPAGTVAVERGVDPKILSIHAGESQFRINSQTGSVTANVESQPILKALDLMLLPLNSDSGGDGGVAGNDYHNQIAPFTPLCGGWKVGGIDAQGSSSEIVHIRGSYDEAAGQYSLAFVHNNQVAISYDFTITKPIKPRQWGVVLTLPASFDTLHWERDAQWTTYPADHIGRPIGTARANAKHRDGIEQPGVALSGSWSLDTMDLGSNDFRSTKYHIRKASLRDEKGFGLEVLSDGSASTRAWVDGSVIHLLVAGFHTGGSDGFFAGMFASERRPLPAGGEIRGSFVLNLLRPPAN